MGFGAVVGLRAASRSRRSVITEAVSRRTVTAKKRKAPGRGFSLSRALSFQDSPKDCSRLSHHSMSLNLST